MELIWVNIDKIFIVIKNAIDLINYQYSISEIDNNSQKIDIYLKDFV